VTVFFARASLTGVLPLVIANRFFNLNRTSIIFWSCGQDVVPLSFSPSKKNIKRLVSKLLAWFVFRGVNYLATGPELMADYYHQHYKIPQHKILTLYNDISMERFYPLSAQQKAISKEAILDTNKKVMLFVHTFNECRGADLLPLIAKNIKDKKLNVVIVAIGRPGDYSDKLTQEIKANNLQDYLLNLGKVPNKDIAKYYQTADLFLMPSRGEGFPRVLLESMACGCPALSFEVGGVADILPVDAIKELLIPLDNENKFVEQSIKLISDQHLLEELSKYSYQKVKQYSTDHIVDMYVDQLSRLTNS
jgi:glycosyltransferase involved in cell wall biosynthesis